MADKTELIRQRMAFKREALSEKLDALEDRTLGVVKETTDAVVQVAETVEDTVQSAKKAVTKTVRKSVHMLDIPRQVDRHPWAMMGGAVATGFFASWLVSRGTRSSESGAGRRESNVYYSGAEPYAENRPQYATPSRPSQPAQPERPSQPGWLSGLWQTFAPSLDTLKQMAIGTTVAVARDLVLQNVPAVLKDQLNDAFNGLSERLVGEPLPEAKTQEPAQSETKPTSEATTPRWDQERERERRHHKKKSHGNGHHREARR